MYAEIVINRKLPGRFDTLTYELASPLEPGHTVWVPFRNRKVAGVVIQSTECKPGYAVRKTMDPIRDNPLLAPWQIALARQIAKTYFTPLSKTLPLFLPKSIWEGKTIKIRKPITDTADPRHNEKSKRHTLTTAQSVIFETIKENAGGRFLLHGVTGSGKTEIYLRLAEEMRRNGKQSLILVPEISLTPQLIEYCKERTSTPISVIHSRLSQGERQREWLSIYSDTSKIIIGSRSALFSPFQNLGLIVMDEEHEWTYKQTDQAPRYHAKNVAEMMGAILSCTLVLGSATPSVETYADKRYTRLALDERINHQKRGMPKTEIVDMREEMQKGNFSIFSDLLRVKLAETLARGKQSLLFINRRGVAPATLCRDCGFVARCTDCRVAMVLHKNKYLICHHCGRSEIPPTKCPSCAGIKIRHIGVGTERVEEELKKLFGKAKIARADRDTTAKKHGFSKLYKDFKENKIDILVGTQMIGKGLDIPNVHLVGVILADTSLHFPDFRSEERTFQLLTQVAGRAGRGEDRGEVIIQTYAPDHPAIRAAALHDYSMFFNTEIAQRKTLEYPPFSNIALLTTSNKSEDIVRNKAIQLANSIQQIDQAAHVNASPAVIPYARELYRWNVIIRSKNLAALMNKAHESMQKILGESFKVDIDPVEF